MKQGANHHTLTAPGLSAFTFQVKFWFPSWGPWFWLESNAGKAHRQLNCRNGVDGGTVSAYVQWFMCNLENIVEEINFIETTKQFHFLVLLNIFPLQIQAEGMDFYRIPKHRTFTQAKANFSLFSFSQKELVYSQSTQSEMGIAAEGKRCTLSVGSQKGQKGCPEESTLKTPSFGKGVCIFQKSFSLPSSYSERNFWRYQYPLPPVPPEFSS